MTYSVEGSFTLMVSVEVEANSEEEALEKAEERLKDYYHLNVHGAHHDPNTGLKFKLDAFEEE